MNPIILAVAIATGNPFVILAAIATTAVVTGVCTAKVIQHLEREEKNIAVAQAVAVTVAQSAKAPVPQALAQVAKTTAVTVEQTAQKINHIAGTTQQQTSNIASVTSSAQRSATSLNQTTHSVQNAASTLADQTAVTQNHLNEISRLNAELAQTTTALRDNQQAIAARERELTDVTAQLRVTQESLQVNTATHQTSASDLINRALRMQTALQENITPLIASKDAEIVSLNHRLTTHKTTLSTANQEADAHNTRVSPLQASSLFSNNTGAQTSTATLQPPHKG